MNEVTSVTTGEVRMSYVHLFKPYAYQPGQEEKYQVTILVPKTDTDTMGRINAAIEAPSRKAFPESGMVCVRRSCRRRCMTGMESDLPMEWHSVRSVKGTGCSQPALRQTIRRR